MAQVDDHSTQIENLKAEIKETHSENKTLQATLIDIARGKDNR